MKKYRFSILTLAILLCFSVSACSENEMTASDLLIPENITSVDLGGGQYNGGWIEPRKLSQAEIEDLNTWVSQLSLIHKTFEKGSSPGDFAGGTAYTFNFNGNETSFSWVDIGTEQYIYYENEWYEITDTQDAPLDVDSNYEGNLQQYEQSNENITAVSFVNGMGCSDPTCTDISHHHDCPVDCADYDHYHNCPLDCTDVNHHHANQATNPHHSDGHHEGNRHH